MSTTEPTTLSARLQEFQTEVDNMKVDGGKANPERTWLILGSLLMIAGIVMSLIAWLTIGGSGKGAKTDDLAAMAIFGLVLAVVGAALFVVMSVRRYFRYWLVRLIFEQREQTDRILNKN